MSTKAKPNAALVALAKVQASRPSQSPFDALPMATPNGGSTAAQEWTRSGGLVRKT